MVRQTWTDLGNVSHVMDFIYDNNGKPYAFYYDGTLYYYITNLQGDVIRIIDTAGATICTYTYDAWGRLLNSSTNQIFKANPIRYRGYYYDTETGLYYLGSRYYDPAVKRFINADDSSYVMVTAGNISDKNLFSYCLNSPVSNADSSGTIINTVIGAVVGAAISGATSYFSGARGAELKGEIVSGAISGAISGAAVDAIAVTGGSAAVVFGAYTLAGAAGGFAGEVAKIKINGSPSTKAACASVAKGTLIGAAFGAAAGITSGPVKSIAKAAKNQGISLFRKLTNKAINFVHNKPVRNLVRRALTEAASGIANWVLRKGYSGVFRMYKGIYTK